VETHTRPDEQPPPGYDPSKFPAFAVTVDVVILTMSDGALHVLLVRRGQAPFEGMWAIPGGFKLPSETLDEAATRELSEETGVQAASLLTQFGAYGDPERDPRMNVVTVGYLAVMRDVGALTAGTDAAEATLMPVSKALGGSVQLAVQIVEELVHGRGEQIQPAVECVAAAMLGAGGVGDLPSDRTKVGWQDGRCRTSRGRYLTAILRSNCALGLRSGSCLSHTRCCRRHFAFIGGATRAV